MYGLSDNDIIYTKNKIENSLIYLNTHGATYLNNENIPTFIPYANFTRNAWHNSDKYIAEIQNRVYGLQKYALDNKLVNIFITLTLPSSYHKTKISKNGKIRHNPKFIDDNEHTPKAGSKMLSKMWKRILDLRPLKNLSKEQRCYFRVTEPHKNGTPHLHISLFLPACTVDSFLSSIFKIYTFPQIDISSQIIPNDYNEYYDKTLKKTVYKKSKIDNFGITTLIKNPTAYLMKYILKTFDDLRKDDDNLTELTLWYIHHSINRFSSSKTLIPLYIYRKINYDKRFQDMYEATKHFKAGHFMLSYNPKAPFEKLISNQYLSKIEYIEDIFCNTYNEEVEMKTSSLWSKRKQINYDDPIPININGKKQYIKDGLILDTLEEFKIYDEEIF